MKPLLFLLFTSALWAQNQQSPPANNPTQTPAPIFLANSQLVQGVGLGYWPTAGSGLTLNLAAGRSRCGNTMTDYPGGTLTMTNSTTNYVGLDLSNNCALIQNTTGYTASMIALARVTTSGGTIVVLNDDRTSGINGALNIGYPGPGVPTTDGASWLTSLTIAGVTRRSCSIIIGSDDASVALVNTNLGPQGDLCEVPVGATLLEVAVKADAGTPSVIVGKNHQGSTLNILSSALSTASNGGFACANAGGTTSLNGATTCSATLQNPPLLAGDLIYLVSGTAGGVAKRMSIFLTWVIQ